MTNIQEIKQSILELMMSHKEMKIDWNTLDKSVESEITTLIEKQRKEIEGLKRKLPYENKSPFPGESVEHHLRTYGHLPEEGCCENDQYTKEQCKDFNEALDQVLSLKSLQ